nr:MAG TPA: hypothetical protein [Caudoviricetes sp.]
MTHSIRQHPSIITSWVPNIVRCELVTARKDEHFWKVNYQGDRTVC